MRSATQARKCEFCALGQESCTSKPVPNCTAVSPSVRLSALLFKDEDVQQPNMPRGVEKIHELSSKVMTRLWHNIGRHQKETP